jgi:hypothetical protein
VPEDDGVVAFAMTAGKAAQDRHAEGRKALAYHVEHRAAVGPRVAIGEIADEEPRGTRQVRSRYQVGQHAVDAVRTLADVLEKDDATRRNSQPPGRSHRMQNGEIAADEAPRGLAASPSDETVPSALARRLFERRYPLTSGCLARDAQGAHHRRVHRRQPVRPRAGVQHREIGETNEPFGAFLHAEPIDEPCDARKAITATRGDDHARIAVERFL